MKKLLAAFIVLTVVNSCKQSQEKNISHSTAVVNEKILANLDKGGGIINNTHSPHVKFKSINSFTNYISTPYRIIKN